MGVAHLLRIPAQVCLALRVGNEVNEHVFKMSRICFDKQFPASVLIPDCDVHRRSEVSVNRLRAVVRVNKPHVSINLGARVWPNIIIHDDST